MNVILIGYRASGKTSVGKLLAERLGQAFVDVDVETCQRFDGLSIREVWERFGEPAWREREADVTRELAAKPGQVIALGGGTLMIDAARAAVKGAADTKRFYLRCDPEELYRRTAADPRSAATRPNLTNLGGGVDEIRAVLAKREPVYREVADHELDVTHTSPEVVTAWVIERLK